MLDPDGEFPARCNQQIVELETAEHPDFTEENFDEVRALVQEHLDRTQSPVAARVLADWDQLRSAWVKIMPVDYKRALRELAEREAAGVSAGG